VDASEDIVMLNGHFITNETYTTEPTAVALSKGRIVAVGCDEDIKPLISSTTRIIDCNKFLVVPGFIDAHMHPFSIARNSMSVNCDHNNVSSVRDIITLLRIKAKQVSSNDWVLGYGYDESELETTQPLDRTSLDLASSDHPIKLTHRSGHITILNSKGLESAHVDSQTIDPLSGIICRYEDSTIPTGVFLYCEEFLKDRLGHTLDHHQFVQAMGNTSESLSKYGITSIQDASYTNDKAHWDTFVELINSDVWKIKTTMMVGIDSIEEFKIEGLTFCSSRRLLRLGHSKIILSSTTGRLTPSQEELHYQIKTSHNLGFPVAIHAVEAEAVQVASEVLEALHKERPIPIDHYDRIEHCSEVPEDLMDSVVKSHAMVVTQPGFLYWRRNQYRETVALDLQPHIYPIHQFAERNIPYAFSSDAPVIDANPWCGIDAILNGTPPFYRGTLAPDAPVLNRLKQAIQPYTLGGAYSENTDIEKGSIKPGKKADIAVFPWSPGNNLPPPESHHAILTMSDGVVIYDDLTS